MLHSKQWHYSLHRDFQNCYSTRRSPTGFFSSNSTRVPIQPPYASYINPENSPSRIQFYMQKTKRSSTTTTTYRGQRNLHSSTRNSMHRRQGDLLEIHPCNLQDHPKTFQPLQAILQVPGILQLECIFYSSIGFHRNSTEYQLMLQTFLQTLHSSKKGRCCDIGLRVRI